MLTVESNMSLKHCHVLLVTKNPRRILIRPPTSEQTFYGCVIQSCELTECKGKKNGFKSTFEVFVTTNGSDRRA
ncbi:hypothetical protein JTE90_007059 [Oedothorax gibbosus]|uniref:Uncharacterized protein n=1 Tax=Oedothorax gibbosus TaxID=931172 RepID=A0AAV6U3A9_9ARAC|nr:hypothetical protein JTE90_007059 [Oedothorax gibbosus]